MRSFIARVLIIITLLPIFFTYCSINSSFASPDDRERLQLHQAISGLQSDADTLAQELLVLDLKTKNAEQKRDLIKKELSVTAAKRDEALIQYNKALETKQQTLARIKPWINFQYRYGYWSLADCILGSSSLSDLLSRTMLVAFILGRQVNDYRAAEYAREVSLQKETALKESVDDLERQNTQLKDQINEIKNVTDQRKAYLEEIKRTSSDLAAQVTSIEARLLYSLDLYNFMTGAMAKIPWDKMQPDSISFSLNGTTMEISGKSINNLLQSSGNNDLKGLSVSLQAGTITLTGKDDKSDSTFTLSGVLSPDEDSEAILFNIKDLSLDGIPVSGEILKQLAEKPAFRIPMPDEMGLFKISQIDISDGSMIVTMQ